jgi:hypothetical protein
MRRALSISGILLVVLAFVGIFAFGMIVSPPPSYMMVAAVEIPAGTTLASVPDASFRQVSVSTDSFVLSTILTGSELRDVQARGGILIKTLLPGEPVMWTSILVSNNPASSDRTVLGLTDPNLVSVVIPIKNLPNGLSAGDYVDLVLVVSNIQNTSSAAYTAPSYGGNVFPPSYGTPQTLAPTESPTPTQTPTPAFVVPISKTIIYGARVANILRAQSVQTSSNAQSSALTLGDVTGLELIVPRQAEELVAMSAAAGELFVFQTSLSAEALKAGPSMGASVQDIIDLFYADRDRMKAQGTPTLIPTMTPYPSNTPGK